mgnify:FL=1
MASGEAIAQLEDDESIGLRIDKSWNERARGRLYEEWRSKVTEKPGGDYCCLNKKLYCTCRVHAVGCSIILKLIYGQYANDPR